MDIVEAFDVTIPSHLKDARLNMTRTAEVVAMNVGHLRRSTAARNWVSRRRQQEDWMMIWFLIRIAIWFVIGAWITGGFDDD